MFEQFELTLDYGHRTEAMGPLFYDELREDQSTWAIPPLMSSTREADTEMQEFDLAYPILTFDRFGTEYRFQIIQLFSFSGGGLQSGAAKDRFTLFPFYFQQRSAESNQNYTALFPLAGKLRNRFFREEIDFVLWPLYVKTIKRPGFGSAGAEDFLTLGNRWAKSRRGDITTYNFVAPIVHLRYGEGLRGWQFWPIAGHEVQSIATRTNAWGDPEMIPGHENSFVLWPIWLRETREIGTTNTSEFRALLPFYTEFRSPLRESTTYLWPFGLTRTDDREKQYRETSFLWPLFTFARGEGKTTTRLGPLYQRSHNDIMERNFYLWPLYKYTRLHSDPLDRERTRILLFLYSDIHEKNTETEFDARRVDLWPVFTHTRDRAGKSRLQVLSLIEPILSKSKSIERNYSPVWALWRSENNARNGASSQSLLWNLYRRQVSESGTKKTSFLFGLVQHRKNAAGDHGLRLFYIPVNRLEEAPAAATVDSPNQMTQLPGKAQP